MRLQWCRLKMMQRVCYGQHVWHWTACAQAASTQYCVPRETCAMFKQDLAMDGSCQSISFIHVKAMNCTFCSCTQARCAKLFSAIGKLSYCKTGA